jgi:hypothetical protein
MLNVGHNSVDTVMGQHMGFQRQANSDYVEAIAEWVFYWEFGSFASLNEFVFGSKQDMQYRPETLHRPVAQTRASFQTFATGKKAGKMPQDHSQPCGQCACCIYLLFFSDLMGNTLSGLLENILGPILVEVKK